MANHKEDELLLCSVNVSCKTNNFTFWKRALKQ